jgi:DNA-binding transcriptional MerR regulator
MASNGKDPDALRTIGELSTELGVAQHILRYWETKFPQLKPMQRAGNRRYYRPADAALARRIHRLLSDEGYTVKGVQKLLRDKTPSSELEKEAPRHPAVASSHRSEETASAPSLDLTALRAIRDRLEDALAG